jgi:hypothetical protein
MASLSELGSGSKQDEEAVIGQGSILSMIGPDVTEEEPSTNTTGSLSRSLEQSAVSNIRQKPAVALKRGSRISNALLSKPVPALYF